MPKTLKLAINETKQVGGLKITLTDIVAETIATAPENEGSYQVGSGAVCHLSDQNNL